LATGHRGARRRPDRELKLLSLQLPVGLSADQDRVDAAALRADITKLITAITIGLSDAD
jgi:hypothetical protein